MNQMKRFVGKWEDWEASGMVWIDPPNVVGTHIVAGNRSHGDVLLVLTDLLKPSRTGDVPPKPIWIDDKGHSFTDDELSYWQHPETADIPWARCAPGTVIDHTNYPAHLGRYVAEKLRREQRARSDTSLTALSQVIENAFRTHNYVGDVLLAVQNDVRHILAAFVAEEKKWSKAHPHEEHR